MSDPHTDDDTKKHVKTYINVFLALLVLTAVTVGVFYVHLSVPVAIGVALLIATFKGSLVANFFMHLNHEQKIIYATLALTVVFFVALIFLPLFTYGDHIGTRSSFNVPQSVSPAVH